MVRLRWLGHSGFELCIDGKCIVIDPFLSENPSSSLKINDIRHADIVAATHAHFDHWPDALEVAKRDRAPLVCVSDHKAAAINAGVEEVVSVNIGGTARIKGIDIHCTAALHTGAPCGFVFSGEGAAYTMQEIQASLGICSYRRDVQTRRGAPAYRRQVHDGALRGSKGGRAHRG